MTGTQAYNLIVWGTFPELVTGFSDWIASSDYVLFVDPVNEDPRKEWVRQCVATEHRKRLFQSIPVLCMDNFPDQTGPHTGLIGNNGTDLNVRVYGPPRSARVFDRSSIYYSAASSDLDDRPAAILTEYASRVDGSDLPVMHLQGDLQYPWLGMFDPENTPDTLLFDDIEYAICKTRFVNTVNDRGNWIIGDLINQTLRSYPTIVSVTEPLGKYTNKTSNWYYILAKTAERYPEGVRDYGELWERHRNRAR